MKYRYWRPISIDYITPGYFPDVALYMKVNGNFVMYKPPERKFTEDDRLRLERNFMEFLYIRAGDMMEINDYLENNLAEMLERKDISGIVKGRILYQTVVNYLIDVFERPELVSCQERYVNLIHLMLLHQYSSTAKERIESLRTVTGLNYYIFGHSVQVAALNLLMHENLFDMNLDGLTDVGIGSLFHDMGMALISDGVLDRPDALCGVEFHKLKQHTQQGYEFMQQLGVFSKSVLDIVRHHHERYDGSGYPTGAKGAAIPITAQATILCDVYNALTTDRYRSHRKRNGMTHEDALKLMREEARAGAYNTELFNQFEEIMNVILMQYEHA